MIHPHRFSVTKLSLVFHPSSGTRYQSLRPKQIYMKGLSTSGQAFLLVIHLISITYRLLYEGSIFSWLNFQLLRCTILTLTLQTFANFKKRVIKETLKSYRCSNGTNIAAGKYLLAEGIQKTEFNTYGGSRGKY